MNSLLDALPVILAVILAALLAGNLLMIASGVIRMIWSIL